MIDHDRLFLEEQAFAAELGRIEPEVREEVMQISCRDALNVARGAFFIQPFFLSEIVEGISRLLVYYEN